MGLRTCIDCKKSMSTSAKSCPHCGALPPKPKSIGCSGMLIIICSGAFLFAIFDTKSPAKPSSKHQPTVTMQNAPPALLAAPKQQTQQPALKTTTPPKAHIEPLPAPFVSPTQYIDLTLEEAARRVGHKPNKAGNIVIETKTAEMLISTSGGPKIAYIDIELIEMGTCSQTKEFDSKPYLIAVGIDPHKLELARKKTHFHTYYDHIKKLKIFVACVDDNWPYTVGISKNYYME